MQLHIILKFAIIFVLLTSSIGGSNTMRLPDRHSNSLNAIGVLGLSKCGNGQKFNSKLNRCMNVWSG
ncbi:hypothetical protein DAPPUDRAFT_310844 [Daphnia pulex]|uniref:Secreted protein n=1 Tax=Daphnia pulex TaxID=6669 RepID=E9FVS2_DAPPU|nr:hypothetical protein DAPPUDRAFT_310844 [Daphnia pulex]|eukprot:EFX89056.1 hypothetical protein DAPPUDRAFT_310844 [Daphnia pulex]